MNNKVGAQEKSGAQIVEACFLAAPDDNGNTPIHLAALEGHCEIVTALLDLGAQVDDKNHIGETALHLAAKEGNEDVVKQLLKAGADPGLKTTGGGTAWHIAAAAGHLGILKLLHAHVNLHKIKDNASPRDIQNSLVKEKNQKGTGKNTLTNEECLESPAAAGKKTGKDNSVRNNPEGNWKDSEKDKKDIGNNKLTNEECLEGHKEPSLGVQSAASGSKKTVKDNSVRSNPEVGRKDSEKDKKDIGNNKLTSEKCLEGHQEPSLGAQSAASGSKKTVKDKSGRSNPEVGRKDSEKDKKETGNKLTSEKCLEGHKEPSLGVQSAASGSKKTVKDKSVRSNPEEDRKNSTGKNSPASHTSRNLVPVLRTRNGSRESPKNNSSDSESFSDSEDYDRPIRFFDQVFGTLSLFHHHSKDLPPRRLLDFKANIVNSICRTKDVDVHLTNEEEWTLLHEAAFTGAEYGVKRLLKKGANVNAMNSDGHTPLFLASAAGWPRIINLLLKAGASTIMNENVGMSVLHAAVAYCQLESVRELLPKVTPNIRGNHGRTPLHLAAAAEEDSIAMGQALIKAGAEVSPRDLLGMTPLDVARLVSNTAFCIFLTYQHRASS